MRSRQKGGYQRRLQEIVAKYMREKGVDQVDLQEVAQWAYDNHEWIDAPYDPVKRCKRDMARALAVQYEIDPQGREIRSMVAVPIVSADNGQMQWEWAPIFRAQPKHFQLSQQVGRNAILADCRQHQRNHESYNDNNVHGAIVELFSYNFEQDLEEERFPTEYPEEDPEV